MRIVKSCAALALVFSVTVSVGATANEEDAGPEMSQEAMEPEDQQANKKICKSFTVTGSRAKREKVCMTRAQWIASQRATRDAANQMTNQDGVCANGNLCSGT